jgi:arylsulfatase A-like enzyme
MVGSRATYNGMTTAWDDGLKNITALFKAKGMWPKTLLVMSSDNGGPIYGGGAANNVSSTSALYLFVLGETVQVVADPQVEHETNISDKPGVLRWYTTADLYLVPWSAKLTLRFGQYPLRGGKMSNWEGGIRTIAVVGGGFLAKELWGTTATGYIHICDWYTQYSYLHS